MKIGKDRAMWLMVAATAVALTVVGASGRFDFPAAVRVTHYVTYHTTDGTEESATKTCRGIPLIYKSCRETRERAAETGESR